MELFVLACIGVLAWLLFDKSRQAPPSSSPASSGAQTDAQAITNASIAQYDEGLSPDDPLYIPPVLGPIRNNPEYH